MFVLSPVGELDGNYARAASEERLEEVGLCRDNTLAKSMGNTQLQLNQTGCYVLSRMNISTVLYRPLNLVLIGLIKKCCDYLPSELSVQS